MYFSTITMCLLFSLIFASNAWAKVSGYIADQGDTIHLELAGQQNWNYDLRRVEKNGKTYLELAVDALDEMSLRKLTGFKSEMIKSVSVDRKGPDGKYIVSLETGGNEVESFDYLTDQPSRLIVDFYINSNAPAASSKIETAKKEAIAKLPEKKKETKTVESKGKNGRKPATTDVLVVQNNSFPNSTISGEGARSGLFDGGDPLFERFTIKDYELKEDALIRSKENYYIPFPMIESQSAYWEKMKMATPIYDIAAKDNDENKQARLLLTLFEKKRYAVYLKTQDWFEKKYPESEYAEVINFMTADVYKALWEEKNDPKYYEIAQVKYKQALEKHPKSPLAERTSLMLGYMALEKGDSLNSIRLFNEHIEKNYAVKTDAISNDLARIGTGVAYGKLNRFQEATEIFEKLKKNSPHKEIRSEAAYRLGDIFVQAKNYQKAVDAYKDAVKLFPEQEKEHPNAFYNQAEALFGMEKYPQSLDAYREFVKKFPSHEHAAFAMTRMGELLEILGADKSRVVGAYLETYFRYGESPSAVIARLRLMSTRMKAMKPKEVDAASKEILSLVKKLDIPNMEQFGTIMIADGYTNRDEFEKSIDLLTKYYQQNPTSVDRDLFKKRIVDNITEEMKEQANSGDFISVLKTHRKYADNWLKGNERIDTRYYLGRAFEMAGTPAESEKQYKEVLNRVYAIRGSTQDKELTVFNQKPNEDELNLRLAATVFQQGKYNSAYDYLKNMKYPEKLSEEDQIERVQLATELLEKRGDLDSSVRYLTELLKTWKGQPALVAEPYLRLAQLEIKQGKPESAIESLKKIDVLMTDSEKVPEITHAKSLELLGQLYLDKGDENSAIKAFDQLLKKYEEKRPLASIRYKLGQIYFRRGEVQKASEVWASLQNGKNEFWYKLAQEQLKNSEWRGDYKKYIQRIPAMSDQQ